MSDSTAPDLYQCAYCGGTFRKGWTDEEAEFERSSLLGAGPQEAFALVCEDCFQQFMEWMGKYNPGSMRQ